MTTPPIQPPPTPAEEYAAAGVPPEQLAAFARLQNAQTPAEYAAAAQAAGLTGQAMQAAAGQLAAGVAPGPVSAPSFEEQLAESLKRNAALEAQLGTINASIQSQLASLQAQVSAAQAAIPARVDPVTESATKVVRAFADIAASDAKNIARSALHSHLTNLALDDLAKLL